MTATRYANGKYRCTTTSQNQTSQMVWGQIEQEPNVSEMYMNVGFNQDTGNCAFYYTVTYMYPDHARTFLRSILVDRRGKVIEDHTDLLAEGGGKIGA